VKWAVALGDIIKVSILLLHNQKEFEESQKDDDITSRPTIKIKNLPRMFEAIEAAHWTNCGKDGTPLKYVARKALKPLPERQDPSNGYPSIDDKLVDMSPIVLAGVFGTDKELKRNPMAHHTAFKVDLLSSITYMWELLEASRMWVRANAIAKKTKTGMSVFAPFVVI